MKFLEKRINRIILSIPALAGFMIACILHFGYNLIDNIELANTLLACGLWMMFWIILYFSKSYNTLILLFAVITMYGCAPKDLKYKVGDVVYLRPDSSLGVINMKLSSHITANDYQVMVSDKLGNKSLIEIKKELIFN